MSTSAEAEENKQITLRKFANRNFLFSLILFAVLISIIFAAFKQSQDNMVSLEQSYRNQFQLEEFKASLANVMLPLNDFTLTAAKENFSLLRAASDHYQSEHKKIASIPGLSDENRKALGQAHDLMSEVLNIANDIADGKISANQAGRVSLLAQNLVLTAQHKLESIITANALQLKSSSAKRELETRIQFYILLGFILIIVLLLEIFNRKLLKRAHTVSEASSRIAMSADSILSATEQQAGLADKHATQVEKITKGLAQIAESDEKIANATIKIGKATDSTAALARESAGKAVSVVRVMGAIRSDARLVIEQSRRADDRAKHILGLIDSLRDSAEEAQLMALNASIDISSVEAAGGQRFSDIASEIRKVADRTSEFCEEMRAMTTDIRHSIRDSAGAAQKGIIKADHCLEIMRDTDEMLKKMQLMSEKTSKSVSVIAQATTRQNERGQGLLKALQHVSGLLHISEAQLRESQDASARLNQASEKLQKMS
jgi:methyl-accepting chemotaxis protein